MPIAKIIVLVGWAAIQLGTEAIKAHNLNKELKLKEKESKKEETK